MLIFGVKSTHLQRQTLVEAWKNVIRIISILTRKKRRESQGFFLSIFGWRRWVDGPVIQIRIHVSNPRLHPQPTSSKPNLQPTPIRLEITTQTQNHLFWFNVTQPIHATREPEFVTRQLIQRFSAGLQHVIDSISLFREAQLRRVHEDQVCPSCQAQFQGAKSRLYRLRTWEQDIKALWSYRRTSSCVARRCLRRELLLIVERCGRGESEPRTIHSGVLRHRAKKGGGQHRALSLPPTAALARLHQHRPQLLMCPLNQWSSQHRILRIWCWMPIMMMFWWPGTRLLKTY